MAITSVRIPDLTKQAVDELAGREGKTAHAFMLEAIDEKIASTRQRQAFLDEGRAALQQVQANGRTVTLDEMAVWMRARAQGKDIEAPQGE